jgi:hypothetical protein
MLLWSHRIRLNLRASTVVNLPSSLLRLHSLTYSIGLQLPATYSTLHLTGYH